MIYCISKVLSPLRTARIRSASTQWVIGCDQRCASLTILHLIWEYPSAGTSPSGHVRVHTFSVPFLKVFNFNFFLKTDQIWFKIVNIELNRSRMRMMVMMAVMIVIQIKVAGLTRGTSTFLYLMIVLKLSMIKLYRSCELWLWWWWFPWGASSTWCS